jgi:sortase A
MRTAVVRTIEWAAWTIGGLLLLIFLTARFDSCVQRRSGLAEFEAARARSLPPDESGLATARPSSDSTSVDTSLWAEGRIRGYEESLELDLGRTIAILRIPKIRLEVPVLEGTDEMTLNRGLGRIPGTARPGEESNLGLAGHRDGFFRGLKDVSIGDRIELETLSGLESYVIEEILIVEPKDVHVLDPTPEPSLTLVTCYPFYFIGSAPERYIVRAALSSPSS